MQAKLNINLMWSLFRGTKLITKDYICLNYLLEGTIFKITSSRIKIIADKLVLWENASLCDVLVCRTVAYRFDRIWCCHIVDRTSWQCHGGTLGWLFPLFAVYRIQVTIYDAFYSLQNHTSQLYHYLHDLLCTCECFVNHGNINIDGILS